MRSLDQERNGCGPSRLMTLASCHAAGSVKKLFAKDRLDYVWRGG